MLQPRTLVIDVPDSRVEVVVDFWSNALGATPAWPDDDDVPFVPLTGARSVLEVVVQRSVGVPRYHLDVPADTPHDTVDRLLKEGATTARRDGDHWVLRDPAGLLFCLVPVEPVQQTPAPVAPREPARAYLDGLFIDVPRRYEEVELSFWSHAFDGEVTATGRPETYTAIEGVQGPGGDLLVEVQRLRDGAPRFHVDLSTDDVAGEADRLEALGATRIHEVETWVTLADPAGNLFCVVPS